MSRTIRVLIADDHELARKGIRTILQRDPVFEVVGEAANAWEAVELARKLRPDLVLMDIRMPGNGLEATREIKAELPDVSIVVVTVSHDVHDFFEAVRRGAQGYLLKNLPADEWTQYLRSIVNSEVPLSRTVAERILREIQAAIPAAGSVVQDVLTQREREILAEVARGATNREIAEKLNISKYTVKNHVKNILEKLNLDNRTQLARFAIENRLEITR